MRSNSGQDESRNNLRDPTLRESGRTRTKRPPSGKTATTQMGSGARKFGQRGEKG